jgi:hypothetical protein
VRIATVKGHGGQHLAKLILISPPRKGNTMNTVTKLCPLVFAAVFALASAPAHAQFGGDQMSQFAPLMELMKQKMGKKRFGRMMQTIGPMMMNMMGNNTGFTGGGAGSFDTGGFFGGNLGGTGDMFNSHQGVGNMMSMLGSEEGISSIMNMIGGFAGHNGRRGMRGAAQNLKHARARGQHEP